MNIKHLITAAAILATAGAASAQQTEWIAADAGFVSSKTRAEVKAELKQAYADGSLGTMARDGTDPLPLARNTQSGGKSRAAVIAERNQAYTDGTLGIMMRDGQDSPQLAASQHNQRATHANRSLFGANGS